MLVPLTASLYVPGTLDDADKVLVDVGTGYFIEVSLVDFGTLLLGCHSSVLDSFFLLHPTLFIFYRWNFFQHMVNVLVLQHVFSCAFCWVIHADFLWRLTCRFTFYVGYLFISIVPTYLKLFWFITTNCCWLLSSVRILWFSDPALSTII